MGEADGGGGQVRGWSMLHAHEGECPVSRQGKHLTQGSGGTVPAPAWCLVTGALRGVPTESGWSRRQCAPFQ